jgi:hypothetical protein
MLDSGKIKEAIRAYAQKYAVEVWADLMDSGVNGIPEDIRNETLKASRSVTSLLDDAFEELSVLRELYRRLKPYIPLGPNRGEFSIGGDGQDSIYRTRDYYETKKNEKTNC